MKCEYIRIGGIPAILWGEESSSLFIYVHGKGSAKEEAAEFAEIVGEYGFQTLSFDLPGCGVRGNICSACKVEPCELEYAVRDLGIIREYAESRSCELSLFAKDHAEFCLEAFKCGGFERCIFVSPDKRDGLDALGKKVSVGTPVILSSFIISSL